MAPGRRREAGAGPSGQALPVMLVAVWLILAGAAMVVTLGRAHLAGARAQSLADSAAITAGRELRRGLASGTGPAAVTEGRLVRAAAPIARRGGGRLERVHLVDGGEVPLRVRVVVALPGPMGTTVRAAAGAAVVVNERIGGDGSPRGWAQGGGYSGPLVYRDGKPMCPAVGAAFDLMRAAARADGVELVVNSGFRGDAEQAILFARHPDPRWVAPPGRSRHRDATELDISMGQGGRAHPWLARNASRFGFSVRYSWEPWHIGYLPGCGLGGAAATAPAGTVPTWVPVRHRAAVAVAAHRHGVDVRVLAALLAVESDFRTWAVSPAGARGIAQLMPDTARDLGVTDPHDARQAIPAAAALLAEHLRTFGSLPLALAAYNAGPAAVRRHGGIPPFPETQSHVIRVMTKAGLGAGVAAGPSEVVLTHIEGSRL